MSFNGSGLFSINSAGQPVVASTLITAVAFNTLMADIATGISTCIAKDGQSTISANIPFSGFKATGLGPGTARTDAATLANVQDSTGIYVATVGGTADAITLTPSPAIAAYVAGQTFRFIASGVNTTAVTVAVSGLAAKAITKNGTTALIAGDIPSASMATITYDGTRFILGTTGASTAIPASLIDAAGDLLVGTADNTVGRLALGTARQVLQVNAGATAPAWATPITLATPQVSTSGTSIDFTGIPAGVKRITVMFNEISTNGTSLLRVQLGDSGGIEVTGYRGAISNGNGSDNVWDSEAGIDMDQGNAAAGIYTGVLTLTLLNSSTNVWSAHGSLARTDSSDAYYTVGRKATSAVLDRIRVTTLNGTDAFDLGEINIAYE